MIAQNSNGTYTASCECDPDRICCLDCQKMAAKYFLYNDIPRSHWPIFLQDKFQDITKESVIQEVEAYKSSPERTNSLLERILTKLNDSIF